MSGARSLSQEESDRFLHIIVISSKARSAEGMIEPGA